MLKTKFYPNNMSLRRTGSVSDFQHLCLDVPEQLPNCEDLASLLPGRVHHHDGLLVLPLPALGACLAAALSNTFSRSVCCHSWNIYYHLGDLVQIPSHMETGP